MLTIGQVARGARVHLDTVRYYERRGLLVGRRARGAIARLDRQLAELQRMRGALARLVGACRSRHPTDDCPLLDAIEPRPEEAASGHSTG